MNLPAEFPCYFPADGVFHLLHWWTNNDRGHIALARSEPTLIYLAKRIFEENPNAEIKAYLEVEMVAPSLHFRSLAEKEKKRQNVERFCTQILWRVKELVEAKKPLPALFTECKSYQPSEEFYSDDEKEYATENHSSCLNCKEGIIFSIPPTELYERYAEKWKQIDAKPEIKKTTQKNQTPTPKPSSARLLADHEKFHYAISYFGDHSSGIKLMEDPQLLSEEDAKLHECFSGRILFFYQIRQLKDQTHLQAILNQIKLENEEKYEMLIKRQDQEREQYISNELKKTYDLFK